VRSRGLSRFFEKEGLMDFLKPIYDIAERIGYSHPLHPPVAHVPIGIIVGLLVVTLVAILFRRRTLAASAHFPFVVIAFIFVFPLALLGLADWQHFYEGVWLFPIKAKLFLTSVLILLLAVGISFTKKGKGATKAVLVIYVLCFLTVGGLGYFGANLIFGTTSRNKEEPKLFVAGQKVFAAQCSGCHTDVMPLSNSNYAVTFSTFLSFLRKPSGGMPALPKATLSNDEAMKVYHFVLQYPCEMSSGSTK
jgi:hypothetical protein